MGVVLTNPIGTEVQASRLMRHWALIVDVEKFRRVVAEAQREARHRTPRQKFLCVCGRFNRCGCITSPSTAGPQGEPGVYRGTPGESPITLPVGLHRFSMAC
jgi:hypothetical protein